MTNLENLSKEERQAVLDILNEMSSTGTSDKLNSLILEDWNEVPVDIDTFIHDKKYLGNGVIYSIINNIKYIPIVFTIELAYITPLIIANYYILRTVLNILTNIIKNQWLYWINITNIYI